MGLAYIFPPEATGSKGFQDINDTDVLHVRCALPDFINFLVITEKYIGLHCVLIYLFCFHYRFIEDQTSQKVRLPLLIHLPGCPSSFSVFDLLNLSNYFES